jgi:hypothetical protein
MNGYCNCSTLIRLTLLLQSGAIHAAIAPHVIAFKYAQSVAERASQILAQQMQGCNMQGGIHGT